MKHASTLLLFAAAILPAAAGAAGQAASEQAILRVERAAVPKKAEVPQPDETRSYKQANGQDLKFYIFRPENFRPEDRRPLMLMFHGGGWRAGEPSQFFRHCRDYTKLGFVAISASYRLSPKELPQNTPFHAVEDARSAVRYAKTHAAELGIDPDRIVTAGSSAGAHIAIGTAVLDQLDDPTDDRSVSSRPAAVILYWPVIDAGPPPGYKHIYKRLGDDYVRFSPIHNLKKDLPPQLILLGDQDTVLSVDHAGEYRKRVEALGSRCDLVVFPGARHGAFYGGKFYEPGRTAAEKFLTELKLTPQPQP